MLGKVLCFLSLVLLVVCDSNWYDSEDEEDAIINYLLNGESFEMDASGETLDEPEPVLNGGIWKCGACDDMSESKLIYSEVNQIDADVDNKSVDIQVGVTLHSMRCVTVLASSAGVVRRMSGSCRGPTVTLTVLPVQHFTLQVYGE